MNGEVQPLLERSRQVMQHTVNPDQPDTHVLQCMEVWNGNQNIENVVESPGMEAWIFSQPYHGQSQGGDVHYLSLCIGGIVTRVLLADVAGHGARVADTSNALRKLLRRFMNAKKQDKLVSELNRKFTELDGERRFATAVVATLLSHKSKLLLTNAGHPRPLLYRVAAKRWEYLHEDALLEIDRDNLPLGIKAASSYQHFILSIKPGDCLLLYTDAITEAINDRNEQLGEGGLLDIVRQVDVAQSAADLGRQIHAKVRAFSTDMNTRDDTTLIAIRFKRDRRKPGMAERLRGYSKALFER